MNGGPNPLPETMPVGVIVPTFNRSAALAECLRHLEAQTWKAFELIVVDDGSSDDTAAVVEAFRAESALRLRYLRQQNAGPARARNYAAREMCAPVCILVGDDIFPRPEFVERHLEFHREHKELEAVAVGLTRWSETGQKVTPFMRWLDSEGIQFAYGDLMRGVEPDWRHFYTSNLSMKTDYLRAHPFDEAFRRAAMEDIELGYRMAARHGLQMHFLPEAEAEHLHPTTFLQACRRMVGVGESQYLLGERWPQFRRTPPASVVKRAGAAVLTEPRVVLPLVARLANQLQRVWCPNPWMLKTLELHARRGYEQAAAAAAALTKRTAEHPRGGGAD